MKRLLLFMVATVLVALACEWTGSGGTNLVIQPGTMSAVSMQTITKQ